MKTVQRAKVVSTVLLLATAMAARAQDYIDVQNRATGNHTHYPVASFDFVDAYYNYSITSAGRIEIFEDGDTIRRIEHEPNAHYTSGRHTFSGDLKIEQVSGTIVFQVFNAAASGPIIFLEATTANGGSLKKYSGGVVVATNILNKWINVKVVHDLNADTMSVYIDGVLKWSGAGGAGGFSGGMKYGIYGGDTRPCRAQWRNTQWDDGTFVKIVNRNSGKALNVSGGSTTAGAQIIQWPYTGDSNRNDEWIIVDIGAGYRQIQNRKSWLVLNVDAASTADGANIIQWPYTAATPTNDEWQIIPTSSGYVQIKNRNSGKVLNVDGASLADGANIIQWPYTSSTPYNDEWMITTVP